VIVTVFNAEPYLAEAIDSVLAQTYAPLELIVLDDGSTDGSRAVIESYGDAVRAVFQDRGGIGAARNRALEVARGDILGFIDADDRYVPDKIERQMAVLDADPSVDMVFGHIREFVSPDVDPAVAASLRAPVDDAPWRMTNLMLVRRSSFDRVGPFSTAIRVGIGVDWVTRAKDAGLIEAVPPAVVYERRLHGENNGLRESEHRSHYLRVLKESLDRRRQTDSGGTPAGS
jgi:glycosyltransferase involved in cell wall biosynthesis